MMVIMVTMIMMMIVMVMMMMMMMMMMNAERRRSVWKREGSSSYTKPIKYIPLFFKNECFNTILLLILLY